MKALNVLEVTLPALQEIAKCIATALSPPGVLFLKGDLGTGKTAFARFFIQALLGKETFVPSPTFSLIQVYETPKGPLWHCDLYRLKKASEIVELGLLEAFHEALCLIEWPEKIEELFEGIFPEPFLIFEFSIIDESRRTLCITGKNHGEIAGALERACLPHLLR